MQGWLRDDAAFLENVRRGKAVEVQVAVDLLLEGLPVRLVQPRIVPADEQRAGQLHDEADLVVGRELVEVKRRELAFTGAADYPFATAFVGRCSRWDDRDSDPIGTVLVSSSCGRVVVPRSSRPYWVVETRFDRITNRDETSYACPRDLLRSWSQLVAALRLGLEPDV